MQILEVKNRILSFDELRFNASSLQISKCIYHFFVFVISSFERGSVLGGRIGAVLAFLPTRQDFHGRRPRPCAFLCNFVGINVIALWPTI